MTSPLDIARRFTGLDAGSRHHLELLMATWSLLADLSFSDLLLYVPLEQYSSPDADADADAAPATPATPATPVTHAAATKPPIPATPATPAPAPGSRGVHFVVLGQIRPTTGRTLFELDLVGQVVAASQLPLVVACWRQGVTTAGEEREGSAVCQVQCVPVRWRGEVLAVLCRSWSPDVGRRPGQLERTYLDVFDRFTTMIADGIFPFVTDDAAIEEAPRVGDGVIIVDEYARVTFTSPNALSALHRMGVVSVVAGSSISSLGDTNVVERAFTTRLPEIEEVERSGDVVVMFRCIPLVAAGEVSGAVLLVRDVSDLRRRDRLLLSKDAAIREVHHRVKNNLQTISSLLRLQARRLDSPGARAALLESERRVRSIALVHELLSRESGDHVPFGEIVHALVRMAMDSNVTSRTVSIRVDGDPGEVATDVATPLAVVLAELLQNAVQHAFVSPREAAVGNGNARAGAESGTGGRKGDDGAEGGGDSPAGPARVDLVFMPGPDRLRVEVRDNGQGLPSGFDIDTSGSLGLAIVRDLVRSQLSGTMEMSSGDGTVVRLTVPLLSRPLRRG